MDIVNLYPSIPQQGCLEVINEELQTHHSLLMFNPNLITNLLSLHMNNNFFELPQPMSESFIIGSNVAMMALMDQCIQITNIEVYLILATLSKNTAYILKMHMHLELDRPDCSDVVFTVSENGSISAVTNYVLWKLMTD